MGHEKRESCTKKQPCSQESNQLVNLFKSYSDFRASEFV